MTPAVKTVATMMGALAVALGVTEGDMRVMDDEGVTLVVASAEPDRVTVPERLGVTVALDVRVTLGVLLGVAELEGVIDGVGAMQLHSIAPPDAPVALIPVVGSAVPLPL